MTFAKAPPKLRLFLREEPVVAPEPRKEDCITLKESMGISHLPGFFLGVVGAILEALEFVLEIDHIVSLLVPERPILHTA